MQSPGHSMQSPKQFIYIYNFVPLYMCSTTSIFFLLLCLASYSSFKTQSKCHLLPGVLPAPQQFTTIFHFSLCTLSSNMPDPFSRYLLGPYYFCVFAHSSIFLEHSSSDASTSQTPTHFLKLLSLISDLVHLFQAQIIVAPGNNNQNACQPLQSSTDTHVFPVNPQHSLMRQLLLLTLFQR